MILQSRILVFGSLLAFMLLSCSANCRAEQNQTQPRTPSIPTIEALPTSPLPSGQFEDWCGSSGKILVEAARGTEIYDGVVKASPLTFPGNSTLACGNDGQRLIFIDEEAGLVSDVDIPAGVVTRTLANYDKRLTAEISFSPDLKSVASTVPLTLVSSTVDLNVISLNGPGRRPIGRIRWSRDSSEFFGISAPEGKADSRTVEIFNAQHQRMGSGPLPSGFLFTDGWFADSQTLYLYLTPARDEFGAGSLFKCKIAAWKCEQIARNVLGASVGGDGILAIVRAIGKYSNDGETITYPPAYLAEIRNGASHAMTRQTFKSANRYEFNLSVAPSGTKAILTWFETCPPEKQDGELCRLGKRRAIMIDLTGKAK